MWTYVRVFKICLSLRLQTIQPPPPFSSPAPPPPRRRGRAPPHRINIQQGGRAFPRQAPLLPRRRPARRLPEAPLPNPSPSLHIQQAGLRLSLYLSRRGSGGEEPGGGRSSGRSPPAADPASTSPLGWSSTTADPVGRSLPVADADPEEARGGGAGAGAKDDYARCSMTWLVFFLMFCEFVQGLLL